MGCAGCAAALFGCDAEKQPAWAGAVWKFSDSNGPGRTRFLGYTGVVFTHEFGRLP